MDKCPMPASKTCSMAAAWEPLPENTDFVDLCYVIVSYFYIYIVNHSPLYYTLLRYHHTCAIIKRENKSPVSRRRLKIMETEDHSGAFDIVNPFISHRQRGWNGQRVQETDSCLCTLR